MSGSLHRCPREEADLFSERAFALGLGKLGDQIGERDKIDRLASTDRLDRKRGCNVALSGAGRPQQMDDLGALDEVEAGEREDAIAVERRL